MIVGFIYTLLFVSSVLFERAFLFAPLILSLVFIVYYLYKSDAQKSLMHSIVFFLSIFALLTENIAIVKLYPFLVSALIFGFFTYLTLSKKSILSAGFKRFSKKSLPLEFEDFLYRSQYFWIGVLGLNLFLHLYFYTQNELIWASYALFGWYILLFVALLLNITYGKLNSVNRFETV